MSGSMWRCSGAHWTRTGLAWVAFTAVVANLPAGSPEAPRLAISQASAAAVPAMKVSAMTFERPRAVTLAYKPFTVEALQGARFGDEDGRDIVARLK